MKAIIHTKYGPPDELQLAEVEKPIPADNEVLIKIHATTVTSSDCNIRNFTFVPAAFKIPARLMFGIFKPKHLILGMDISGEIESIGKNVSRFKVGDQIFGSTGKKFGTYAEFTALPENAIITQKPANATWEEAAAISLGTQTAYYFLKDLGNIQAGQKILINGASGAIGTYAVQLAKYFGAEVTGVCSTTNLELVKSLGADHVIDRTKEDFTRGKKTYDHILDTVGKTSFSKCKHILSKDGIFLAVLVGLTEIFQIIWTSFIGGKKVKGGEAIDRLENLIFFKKLIEEKKLKPVIDKTYALEELADAFAYVEKGHKKGNVVIITHR